MPKQDTLQTKTDLNKIEIKVSNTWKTFFTCLKITIIFYISLFIAKDNYKLMLVIGLILFTFLTIILFVGSIYLSMLRKSRWKVYSQRYDMMLKGLNKSKKKEDR
jgi:uncharacterized membrane protein YgdD (TMEM256/DUF423 family)